MLKVSSILDLKRPTVPKNTKYNDARDRKRQGEDKEELFKVTVYVE